MLTRSFVAIIALASLGAGTATPALGQQAQQTTVARRPDVPTGRMVPSPSARGTSVMGFAWSATNDPIPNAPVRLRNVLTGTVEATAVTSQAGEFSFENVEGGTYVVELVDESGRVRAIGHQFTAAPGETIATFVRLAAEAPWFVGLFSNTAAAAVSTAAAAGIAAIAPPAQPLSATR